MWKCDHLNSFFSSLHGHGSPKERKEEDWNECVPILESIALFNSLELDIVPFPGCATIGNGRRSKYKCKLPSPTRCYLCYLCSARGATLSFRVDRNSGLFPLGKVMGQLKAMVQHIAHGWEDFTAPASVRLQGLMYVYVYGHLYIASGSINLS